MTPEEMLDVIEAIDEANARHEADPPPLDVELAPTADPGVPIHTTDAEGDGHEPP